MSELIDQMAHDIARSLSGIEHKTATAKRQPRKACRCNCHGFDWPGFCHYCGCEEAR